MSPRTRPLVAAAAAASLCLAGSAAADEAKSTTTAAGGVPVCLHDNGVPDLLTGFSNRVEAVGSRRTVLDDFTVPDGETWRVTGLHHFHVWEKLFPPQGTGLEIDIRADDGGTPGAFMQTLTVTDYSEVPTGRTVFGRDEAESWTTIEAVDLPTGTYWFEATVVGPENDYWLTAPVQGNECYVNYEGLRPSTEFPPIGVPSDLNWCISGEILATCPEDLDGNMSVDFGDILVILGNWGPCEEPCPPCPQDLDGDCDVTFSEIIMVLAAWGPCI